MSKRLFACLLLSVAVSGCADFLRKTPVIAPTANSPEAADVPVSVQSAPPPPKGAQTVEEFDTTSTQARQEAVAQAVPATGDQFLGVTIASLGAAAEPGIWMKTPLVRTAAKGRVEYAQNGTRVVVDLLPIEGDIGAGSQLSLAAMRLLDVPLTDLSEVKVYQIVE